MQKDIAMKMIHLVSATVLGSILLVGCTSTKTHKTTASAALQPEKAVIKNPMAITLYTGKQKPGQPYVVLGHETVSKYNRVGIKRQEANLKDSMRHLAATKGGDAVIEITNLGDSISYTVISYKNSSTIETSNKA